MKSEKGVTLSSLIIYVIAMIIVVSIIAVMTRFFYGNINELSNNANSLREVTKLNSFITEEVNKLDNTIYYCDPDGSFIVFYNPSDKDELNTNSGYTQYTFENDSIYLNKVKICTGIESCIFEDVSDENNYKFKIIVTIDGNQRETTYTLKTSK